MKTSTKVLGALCALVFALMLLFLQESSVSLHLSDVLRSICSRSMRLQISRIGSMQ